MIPRLVAKLVASLFHAVAPQLCSIWGYHQACLAQGAVLGYATSW